MLKSALIYSLFCLSFFLTSTLTVAQEIDFGDYYDYSLSVAEQDPGNFEFGTIISGSGLNTYGIASSKVLTITGVKYLDVFLTITADAELLLDGNLGCENDLSCSIDYTLEAAYANRGSDDISQARIINVVANSATAQFPVKYRSGGPPAPPPTPVYNGYDPSAFNETAYLYLYGSIDVGNVDTGNYSSNINIMIIYD